MVTVQAPVPVQAPPHPPKGELPEGVAVRETTAPGVQAVVQVVPEEPEQLTPEPVTLPAPPPPIVIVSDLMAAWKDAPTLLAALIVTVQAPVPVHAPDHPAKSASPTGAAESVTVEPAAGLATQAPLVPAPQSIPEPVTFPFPVTVTVSG
jgi:hypothetical protein